MKKTKTRTLVVKSVLDDLHDKDGVPARTVWAVPPGTPLTPRHSIGRTKQVTRSVLIVGPYALSIKAGDRISVEDPVLHSSFRINVPELDLKDFPLDVRIMLIDEVTFA